MSQNLPPQPQTPPGHGRPGAQSPQQPHAQHTPPQQPPQQPPHADQQQADPQRWAAGHALTAEDDQLRESFLQVKAEVAKAVVGQDRAVEGILISLLVGGHVLLEGVPGVAKTLLIRSVAQALTLDSARIQFTPDLMPGDVTGSMIYDASTSAFEFRPGPIFTNLLIADEINRTPPKTQSALLEAMEEQQTSVDGTTYTLPQPFLVAATQNPVEYEGTYPLPEAQLDRFLFKILLHLPQRDTELEILKRHAAGFKAGQLAEAGVTPVLDQERILAARQRVESVYCAPEVLGYIVDLVQATRQAPSLSLGVSPRGATRLLAATRARAWLAGRAFITPDDVKSLIAETFRHRVQLRPEAQMDGIGVEQVLESIIASVAVPR